MYRIGCMFLTTPTSMQNNSDNKNVSVSTIIIECSILDQTSVPFTTVVPYTATQLQNSYH